MPRPASDHDDFIKLVGRGDACRNAQRWADAARCYQQALQLRPSEAGIWVQLGHASKESGAFLLAEAAYLKAHALDPTDGDLLLQLGHFYAIKDKPMDAAAFYRQAVQAGSMDQHARHYLARFGSSNGVPTTEATAALPAIYFEYTDLLSHFATNRNPTGIQRVQIELFRASLAGSVLWSSPVSIHACAFVDRLRAWVAIAPAELLELVELASTPGRFDDLNWQQTTTRFFEGINNRDACVFPIGAALVNLGTSWSLVGYIVAIREMKARYGLRYVPFVHDLIPLITPEFVVPGLATEFNAWFSSAVLHSDLFVTTSRSTCDDVVRAAATVRALDSRPLAMPLDAGSKAVKTTDSLQVARALQRFGLTASKFVLFVGTMEVRKNHYLVFQAWSWLLERHGRGDVPTLVCVGKRGWMFEQAQRFLEARPDIENHIVRLSDISDAELASLYQACLFTVYPSLYEGWGLPVTESLCHGKACLTADHSSLPEAGGRFADYYNGNSLKSFVDQTQRLIFDVDYRQAREHLIDTEFKPRSWHAVLSGLVDGIAARFQQPATPSPACAHVVLGTIYILSKRLFDHRLSRDAAIAEMLRLDGSDWYDVNETCLWSKVERARLAFRLPASVDSDLLVFLKLCAPPAPIAVTIQFEGNGMGAVSLAADESRLVRLDIPIGLVVDDALAVIQVRTNHLTVMSSYDPLDGRRVGVGVEMFMTCLATDIPARLAMIERALMTLEDV